MEEFDFEQNKRDAERAFERMERIEERGVQDILKYFDRIHDKLFSVNNILIGGYLGLIAFKKDVPQSIVILPMLNLLLLLFVDYRMMEKSRLESNLMSISGEQRDKIGTIVQSTNLWSLALIISTIAVTVFFIYFLS